MQKSNNNTDNDYFYAIEDVTKEVKVELSNPHSDNENEQKTSPENKFAVLGRKTAVVSE